MDKTIKLVTNTAFSELGNHINGFNGENVNQAKKIIEGINISCPVVMGERGGTHRYIFRMDSMHVGDTHLDIVPLDGKQVCISFA